jgi:hypothetical protein
MYYDQLVHDKNAMKDIKMNKRKQAQLLGILFAEYQILTTEQASIVRSQMDKPTHVFEDSSSLWAFYNYVTTALQSSHPKTWMEDQRVLHYFISTVNNFMTVPIPIQQEPVNDEEEKVTDPLLTNYGQPENQTNILVQIAEAEEASLELEPSISNLELSITNLEIETEIVQAALAMEALEETVTYTDPVGNTFEAPIIDVVELNRETQMSVIVTSTNEPGDEDWMDGVDESIEPDSNELTVEDTVVSLQPTPEDYIQFEKEQLETEDDFAFDFSDEDDDEEAFF